jgi:hypothetical protein
MAEAAGEESRCGVRFSEGETGAGDGLQWAETKLEAGGYREAERKLEGGGLSGFGAEAGRRGLSAFGDEG